jgi:hypothetical protein
VYLLVFHAYLNEIRGSRSKIPNKKSRSYTRIYDVKFLVLLGAPYIYDISRLRVNNMQEVHPMMYLLYKLNHQRLIFGAGDCSEYWLESSSQIYRVMSFEPKSCSLVREIRSLPGCWDDRQAAVGR